MSDLRISYDAHENVRERIVRLRHCVEDVSLSFDSWSEPYSKGPGLYIALIADRGYGNYADPMGANHWPVERCQHIDETDDFYEALGEVAFENDGAIVVSVDGVVQRQMVRFRDYRDNISDDENLDYQDWMGSRHMSALETSLRPEVVATITLSEESGRVSLFRNGEVETTPKEELGWPWRDERRSA
jgi:hypothetical protein